MYLYCLLWRRHYPITILINRFCLWFWLMCNVKVLCFSLAMLNCLSRPASLLLLSAALIVVFFADGRWTDFSQLTIMQFRDRKFQLIAHIYSLLYTTPSNRFARIDSVAAEEMASCDWLTSRHCADTFRHVIGCLHYSAGITNMFVIHVRRTGTIV